MDSAEGVSHGPDEEELRVVYSENVKSSLTESSTNHEGMHSTIQHELPPGYNLDSFRSDHVVCSVNSSVKPCTETSTVTVLTPEAVKDMYLAEFHAENKSITIEQEEVSDTPQKLDERRKSRNEIFKRRRIMVCLVVLALVIAFVVVLTIVLVLSKNSSTKDSSLNVPLNNTIQNPIQNSSQVPINNSSQIPIPEFSISQISMVSLETAVNADGRVEVFGIDSNMQVYVRKQLQVNSTRWSNWTSLNGQYGQIGAALVRQSGKLTLVATTNGSGSVWATTQVDPNSVEYTQWQSIGGNLKQFTVSVSPDGPIAVIGVGVNDRIQEKVQTSDGKWDLSSWYPIDWVNSIVRVKQVAVGLFADGRMQVFGISVDGNFWYNCFQSDYSNYTLWWGVQNLSNVADQIAVQSVNDTIGRPYVFGINKDNKALLYNQPLGQERTKNSTGFYQWNGWFSLGGLVQQIKTVYNAGLITVFAIGIDYDMSMISQVSPGAGWGSWQLIGYKATQFSVVANAVGCVELFGIHPNSSLWTATLLCS